MRCTLLSALAALILSQTPQSALAQASLPLPYLDNHPEETVTAAFSAPYGVLIVNEFAAILGDSANAACLANKKIAKTALAENARGILVRMGVQLAKKVASVADREVFKAKLTGIAGATAFEELARLPEDPVVSEYIALGRPASLANIANLVTENMDRYLLIRRITLKRPLNPVGAVNMALVDADPTEEIDDKLEEFVESKNSAALKRYLDLLDAAREAYKQSIDPQVAVRFGPVQLMEGLDKELAEVCIGRR